MSNKKRNNGQNMPPRQPQTQQQENQSPIGQKLKTSTGFEYELKAANMADMRFLDALVSMQDASLPEAERVTSTVRVVRYLLGEGQKDAFYAHVVQKYGAASPAAVGKELGDILANFDAGKKK